ncbi:DUF4123 domain-containing protein [Halopseudomonas pelagia]|uniref:DUF4123 domain-containing protein n=1 Tax=Halopseudomonas pelagia TaxID=553151 RepID=UPI0030D794A7|tara:strand:+ start:461 stop:1324 length:864 start_codon:yes stop_codon:yes gene_type:complete
MVETKTHYLLLDGAQIDNLLQRIYELEPAPEPHLLYRQTRYAELADVGPVLVRTEPGSALHAHFHATWAQTAGCELDSSMPEPAIVSHLRSLIHIRTDGDVVLLFRYYDPRIMRLWLADLSIPVREQVMGPIDNISFSGFESGSVQRFANQSKTAGQRYEDRPWLQLSGNQLARLNIAKEQCFDQRLVEHVNRWFPDCLAKADAQQRQQWAAACRRSAAEYGYSSASDVARWAGCVALKGNLFPEAPEHEIFRNLLAQPQTTPMQRLDNVLMEIQRQLLTQDKEPVA